MAVASNWVFAFAVIFLFPVMNKGMGAWGTFLVFSGVSFGATAFGLVVVTEPTTEAPQPDGTRELLSTESEIE
jgi:hypothetical protein